MVAFAKYLPILVQIYAVYGDYYTPSEEVEPAKKGSVVTSLLVSGGFPRPRTGLLAKLQPCGQPPRRQHRGRKPPVVPQPLDRATPVTCGLFDANAWPHRNLVAAAIFVDS
ncbi:hypothetical protein pipiens_016717 [Culex pipiens pipiens]|uniref:Uncharacterized protein n=1 Tax=Culex pipiens pipiens TaxID=38569 RepID=A0ABD1CK31_CULPP